MTENLVVCSKCGTINRLPLSRPAIDAKCGKCKAKVFAGHPEDVAAEIREELVAPRQEAGTLLFTDKEWARVRLICTLHYELEIDAETLPVVLSLVDQLYDTRQRLLSLPRMTTHHRIMS